ncbi:MAG: hypothetical protein ORN28_10095, partial [Rhodoferax sp.]|nr:hypothetical protein [Rhodoferax sp.]
APPLAAPLAATDSSTAKAAPAVAPTQAPRPDSIAVPEPLAAQTTVQNAPAASTRQVRVKTGDSASKIALAAQPEGVSLAQPEGVSLDQLLVAMLRANPEAFVKGNLNRLRDGVMLNLPSPQQARSIDAAEAKRIVLAQSKDFHAFRRNLASNAPATPVESASRSAQGNVQAQVVAPKTAAKSADKLTLSKGAAAQAEISKLTKERSAAEAAQRSAELAKNIAELQQLSATATPAANASTAQSASTAPDAGHGLLDEWQQKPGLLLGLGAVLLALLGGLFVGYRRIQSQRAEDMDSDWQPEFLDDDPVRQAEAASPLASTSALAHLDGEPVTPAEATLPVPREPGDPSDPPPASATNRDLNLDL